MLQVRGLRKSYSGTEVVCGVSFSVAAGECYGLLGPNGAGKTTTLRCCLGLTGSDAGAIELAGLEIPAAARVARARTGVCPQFDNLGQGNNFLPDKWSIGAAPTMTVVPSVTFCRRSWFRCLKHALGRDEAAADPGTRTRQ